MRRHITIFVKFGDEERKPLYRCVDRKGTGHITQCLNMARQLMGSYQYLEYTPKLGYVPWTFKNDLVEITVDTEFVEDVRQKL